MRLFAVTVSFAAPLPDPIIAVSKNKSPADIPDPFETMSARVTAPDAITTFAVTPLQEDKPLLSNNFTLLNVPFV